MTFKNFTLLISIAICFSSLSIFLYGSSLHKPNVDDHPTHASDHDHAEPSSNYSDEHDATEITFSNKQMLLAGVEVKPLIAQSIEILQSAPAEIVSNAYQTFVISSPIESQVISRFKSMGDTVSKSDKLITLFSKDMAKAQSDFLANSNVWQRLKKLPAHTLSIKELDAARIQFEESRDQLIILGMSHFDIEDLHQAHNGTLGQYHLYASSDGIVLNDNAPQGSILPVGHRLFEISNEDSLWVEAHLPANSSFLIKQNDTVRVQVNQQDYLGKVIQNGHSIDPNSRTRLVRISLDNPNHQLHAGQFAQAYFSQSLEKAFFKVPQSASMQIDDGDWIVFIEKAPNKFIMQEISIEKTLDDGYAISGITEHSKVVITGAFFLLSETRKSSFDVHNH